MNEVVFSWQLDIFCLQSIFVAGVHRNKMASFPWKAYAKFLETPVMTVLWGLPFGYMCNDVSNRLQNYNYGVIAFTPYMAMFATLFAISMVWWYCNGKPRELDSCLPLHRQDTSQLISSTRQHPEASARNRRSSLATHRVGDGRREENSGLAFSNNHLSGQSTRNGAPYLATPPLSPFCLPKNGEYSRMNRSSPRSMITGSENIVNHHRLDLSADSNSHRDVQGDSQDNHHKNQTSQLSMIFRAHPGPHSVEHDPNPPAKSMTARDRPEMNGDSRRRVCSSNHLLTESSVKEASDPALNILPPPSHDEGTDCDIHVNEANNTSRRFIIPHQNINVGCSANLSAQKSSDGGQRINGDSSMREFSSSHLPSDGRSGNEAPDRIILSPLHCQVDIEDVPEIIHTGSRRGIMHHHENTRRSVDLSTENSGDGGQGGVIRDLSSRDLSNNYPSDGSIGNSAPDGGAQSQAPKYALDIISANNANDLTKLVEILAEALPSNAPVVSNINYIGSNVDDHDIARLVKAIDPNAVSLGSILLHKKRPPLNAEILRDMRTAMDFDKDCTVQLGTIAILRKTDAGVKCWMLREIWTPTILDINRYPQSFLEFLSGESPKWYATGFNLQNATLAAATSAKKESLNIIHRYKRENGIEVLLFKEPISFPLFPADLHITASNTVEVEEGVTFKLFSDAKKAQSAYRISVIDGLIPKPRTVIIMASLSFLGGSMKALFLRSVHRANQEAVVTSCFALVLVIIISTAYYLLSQMRVLSQENEGMASEGLCDNRETVAGSQVKSLSQQTDTLPQTKATSCKLGAQDHGTNIKRSIQKGALPRLVQSLNKSKNPKLQENAAGANLAMGDKSFARSCIANEKGAFSSLVASFYDDSNTNLQANAGRALCHVAAKEESLRSIILSKESVLSGLVRALSQRDDPTFQAEAARALESLTGGEFVKRRILSEKGALPALVNSLSNFHNPDLQTYAAGVLLNLVSLEKFSDGLVFIKDRILNEHGVLAGLVSSLSQHNNPRLQANAAGALWCLASGGQSMKLRILKEEASIAGLVSCLTKHNHPELQAKATGALNSLVAVKDADMKLKIINEEGALAGLVSSLSKRGNPKLQACAAKALTGLAAGTESNKLRIMNEKGSLTGLLSSLFQQDNSKLQAYAAETLWSLAGGGESIKLAILTEDNAVTALVKSLYKHHNPELQANAAGALWNLAEGGESMKLRILKEEDSIAGLVSCLTKHNHPELQATATGALNSLVAVKDSNMKLKIINEEGALAGLVSSLSKRGNPKLQACAAKALTGLAAGTESNKLRIMNEKGALTGLLSSLFQQDNSKLQAYAAETLWRLAGGGESIKLAILTEDNAVTALVKSLYKHHNPELQANAAGALWNLAEGGESMKLRLLKNTGTVAGLVNCLSVHCNPELQKVAVRALGCLAAGGEAKKLEILKAEKALVDIMEDLSKHGRRDLQEYARSALNHLNDVGKDKKTLEEQSQSGGEGKKLGLGRTTLIGRQRQEALARTTPNCRRRHGTI